MKSRKSPQDDKEERKKKVLDKLEEQKRAEERKQQEKELDKKIGGVDWTDETRKLLTIKPRPKFTEKTKKKRATSGGPGDEQGEYSMDDVKKYTRNLLSVGADPQEEVTIVIPGRRGKSVRGEKVTLGEIAGSDGKERWFTEAAKKGGTIEFGGEGPPPDTPPLDPEERTLFTYFATEMGKEGNSLGNTPKEKKRKRKTAEVVSDLISAIIPDLGSMVGHGGTSATYRGRGGRRRRGPAMPMPYRGPLWFQLDESSRLGHLWFLDNIKYRSQYSVWGHYVSRQWSVIKHWEKSEKIWKKAKKMSDLEKRLDIFHIDIEDVFDLGNLSIEEIYEIEDLEALKPTAKEYQVLQKFMKEEGYVREAEALEAVEAAEEFEPREAYRVD